MNTKGSEAIENVMNDIDDVSDIDDSSGSSGSSGRSGSSGSSGTGELPDFLAPYKHYETEVISGVLDEVVSADDMEDNCPCDSTVASWHHWLMINELRIDGYLKSEGSRLPGFTEELLKTGVSLLKYLRSSCQNWLEIILRFIYNSGGFLVSAWADGYAPTSV